VKEGRTDGTPVDLFQQCPIVYRHHSAAISKFSGLKERSEELTRPSPVFPVPVLWRSHWVGLRHAAMRSQPMMTRIPVADPSPDRDDQLGVPNPTEPLPSPEGGVPVAARLRVAVHGSQIGQRCIAYLPICFCHGERRPEITKTGDQSIPAPPSLC
jgi:hypothetical protein